MESWRRSLLISGPPSCVDKSGWVFLWPVHRVKHVQNVEFLACSGHHCSSRWFRRIYLSILSKSIIETHISRLTRTRKCNATEWRKTQRKRSISPTWCEPVLPHAFRTPVHQLCPGLSERHTQHLLRAYQIALYSTNAVGDSYSSRLGRSKVV